VEGSSPSLCTNIINHLSSDGRGDVAAVWTSAEHARAATQVRISGMESKLAREAKEALIAATQRLTPEERLDAFLAHSRLMVALFKAGQQIRSASRQTGS
jgi:hypothetical protein